MVEEHIEWQGPLERGIERTHEQFEWHFLMIACLLERPLNSSCKSAERQVAAQPGAKHNKIVHRANQASGARLATAWLGPTNDNLVLSACNGAAAT